MLSGLGDRVFHVPAAGIEVTFYGLTIEGGTVPGVESGGGILSAGNLSLNGCIVRDCAAGGSGGGVSATGVLFLPSTVVSNNVAGIAGGGVALSGNLVAYDSVISYNQANDSFGPGAGGISLGGSTASLVRARIIGNKSSGTGGVGLGSGALVIMDMCEVSLNQGGQYAGGLEAFDAVLGLRNCTFSGNTSSTTGTTAGGSTAYLGT